jgi:serine/threonine-protein kinase HipA
MMESLNVFLLGRLAGILEFENGQLSFHYDSEYLESPSVAPISFSMPLRTEPFDSQTTTAFFENLLPPDDVRKRLGKILHLSRHNIFGFLKALGGDCAGAIALYPADATRDKDHTDLPEIRELSLDETVQVLTELPTRPLNMGKEDGFRISGTGAQDKLIACVRNGKVFLPLYGAPSTHIIKPPIAAYSGSVFNELFCMRLAKLIDLPAPQCEILTLADIPYYCVTRYDRRSENGQTFRLHQEDFCQLLSIDPEKKYETEGGPTIPACFKLIREMRLGASGQLDFIRRVIFNCLIGNGDAHAKNFSVLYRGKTTVLAPVYDLLCTEIYPTLSHESAMAIGKDTEFSRITRESFVQMAQDCKIRPAAVLDQIDKLIEITQRHARKLTVELNAEYPSPVYAKIFHVIKKQSAQLAKHASISESNIVL